jgi:hypothetical protein
VDKNFGAFEVKLIAKYPKIRQNLDKTIIYIIYNITLHISDIHGNSRDCTYFFFVPTYSPPMNPIEEVFGIRKSKIRSLNVKIKMNLFKLLSMKHMILYR